MSIPQREGCACCIHRRPMTTREPGSTVCHYLLDTGEARGCSPQQCTRWEPDSTASQWFRLLRRIQEDEKEGCS